jgi:hypothetical protein
MLRLLLLALIVAAGLVGGLAGGAVAQGSTGEGEERLPGTTLEANQRDDGGGSLAPWVIGSGLAAVALIGIGGTVVQRRSAGE